MTDQAKQAEKKPSLKQRLTKLKDRYGVVAVYTYLALSLSAIIGFSIAIGLGMEADSTGGVFGAIAAGWVAAKVTLPLRILATLALTPLIANFLAKRRKARGDDDDDDDDEDDDEDENDRSKDAPAA